MTAPFGIALLAALALSVEPPMQLELKAPYKVDGPWSYYANGKLCTAGMVQASDGAALMMAFDADKKSFTVSFTEQRKSAVPDTEREIGIRLHRSSGALDEGWDDLWFMPIKWADNAVMWVSQPMEETALHDFNDFDSLVFIDHGRTAGTFRARNNQAAVRELKRCAKEQKAKP